MSRASLCACKVRPSLFGGALMLCSLLDPVVIHFKQPLHFFRTDDVEVDGSLLFSL